MQLTTTPAGPALGAMRMDVPSPSPLAAAPPVADAPAAVPSDSKVATLLSLPTDQVVAEAITLLDSASKRTIDAKNAAATVDAVAGATKELTKASLLVQLAHRGAMKSDPSPELELNLMNAATGLAAIPGALAQAAPSVPTPTTIGVLAEQPIANARTALEVVRDHVARTAQQESGVSVGGYL